MVTSVMKIYIRKRGKLNKEKHVQRNGTPESGMELSSVFKEMNSLRNGIKEVMNPEKDPTQPHFQLVKRN